MTVPGDSKMFLIGVAVVGATLAVVGVTLYMAGPEYQHGTTYEFVGPKACAHCHETQFTAWSKTRMSQSFEALRAGTSAQAKKVVGLDPEKDYTHDPKCLPCHTTGYGMVGGFTSIEETPEMAGVTCEACHGPGGRYAATVMSLDDPTFKTAEAVEAGLVYPPREPVCRTCHNERSPFVGMNYKFDYQERVRRGTHEHYQLKYEHDTR